MLYLRKWLICIAALLSISGTIYATPQQSFDQIYGGRVKSLGTVAQRVEFAKQLLRDAANLTDDRPFQSFVYEKAYDLTADEPQGYPIAIEAMESLAKARPDLKSSADEKLMSVLERQCRFGPPSERRLGAEMYVNRVLSLAHASEAAGNTEQALTMLQKASGVASIAGQGWPDDLQDCIKSIRVRQNYGKTAAALETRLDRDPHDANAATALVQLLVLDMDQPGRAVSFVNKADNAALTEAVQLASKKLSTLSQEQLLVVATWYRGQAFKASERGRWTALSRARSYYRQFLKVHASEDARRLNAQTSIDEISRELAGLPSSGFRATVDLLSLVDSSQDAIVGSWRMSESGLISEPAGITNLAIPYMPPAEYDLKIAFESPTATAVVLILSDRNHPFVWVEDDTGTLSGFEFLNGKDITRNITGIKIPGTERPGTHTCRMRVRAGEITAFLDGAMVARYLTNGSDLSLPVWAAVAGYPLGISVSRAPLPVTFSSIELVEVNGKGRLLKHPH